MELIIPNTGRKVIDRCRICKIPRYEGESQSSWESHIIGCIRRNQDRLAADRERQHPAILKPWDPEYARWIQDPARLPGLMSGKIKP